ncbi:hypothetical protein M3Y99_01575300 [Aphelenchoides fujianensis]|nr:hypothetical protein M3Y99_01575300 [Aphelenchoides fujianensis]
MRLSGLRKAGRRLLPQSRRDSRETGSGRTSKQPLLGASDQADEDDERVSGDPTESPSSSSAEMPAFLARSPSVARLLSIPRRFLHLRRFLFVFFLLLVGVVGFAKWKLEAIGEDSLLVAEEPKRYVGAHFIFCNGLANQMYRYASLYAIGKAIGREPYVDSSPSVHDVHPARTKGRDAHLLRRPAFDQDAPFGLHKGGLCDEILLQARQRLQVVENRPVSQVPEAEHRPSAIVQVLPRAQVRTAESVRLLAVAERVRGRLQGQLDRVRSPLHLILHPFL